MALLSENCRIMNELIVEQKWSYHSHDVVFTIPCFNWKFHLRIFIVFIKLEVCNSIRYVMISKKDLSSHISSWSTAISSFNITRLSIIHRRFSSSFFLTWKWNFCVSDTYFSRIFFSFFFFKWTRYGIDFCISASASPHTENFTSICVGLHTTKTTTTTIAAATASVVVVACSMLVCEWRQWKCVKDAIKDLRNRNARCIMWCIDIYIRRYKWTQNNIIRMPIDDFYEIVCSWFHWLIVVFEDNLFINFYLCVLIPTYIYVICLSILKYFHTQYNLYDNSNRDVVVVVFVNFVLKKWRKKASNWLNLQP